MVDGRNEERNGGGSSGRKTMYLKDQLGEGAGPRRRHRPLTTDISVISSFQLEPDKHGELEVQVGQPELK
ncbi:hypothetical protein EVAR_25708_1 [Eumeta japonica]|uniref:Uncharacterized protein n=1 Tax=Eumeta variegata TaxID=151549 RepID=A0A4C1YTZ1_EUMVA|nr:hypothetical protein EVAR_25708_1 [Eumeta japonica]